MSIREYWVKEQIVDNTMTECLDFFYEMSEEEGWPRFTFSKGSKEELHEFINSVYEGALEFYEREEDENADESNKIRPIDAMTVDRLVKTIVVEKMFTLRAVAVVNDLIEEIKRLKGIED